MWPFRKVPSDLEDNTKEQLNKFFEYSPSLYLAYNFRQELTEIFDKAPSKHAATSSILAWKTRVENTTLTSFDSFLTTLDNWLDEITNYFLDPESSSFVEGLNNKIYGFFNPVHLFQRIFLALEGYSLFCLFLNSI